LTITEYVDDNSLTHIDLDQVATGNIRTRELRTLDWVFRDHVDKVFGEVAARARWAKLDDVDDDDFLKTGWDDMEGMHVQSWAESKTNGWTTNQVRCASTPQRYWEDGSVSRRRSLMETTVDRRSGVSRC
jgi:hypothetical protein